MPMRGLPKARRRAWPICWLAAHFGLAEADLARLGQPERGRFAAIAAMDEGVLGGIFMKAAEWTYRNALAPKLQAAAAALPLAPAPDAQLVFCIDVRSEPFRRSLEAEGRYETFGYAGFFGLPIALHRLGDARRTRLLPVLLAPQHDVAEAAIPGREQQAAARRGRGRPPRCWMRASRGRPRPSPRPRPPARWPVC
jgi:hypothetical protein